MALYNEGLSATIGSQIDTLQEKGSFSIKPARVKFVFLDLEQIFKYLINISKLNLAIIEIAFSFLIILQISIY
jgi:hypothetical protein